MKELSLMAPCHFGLEAVLKREIYDLGYEITRVEDGRVYYEGDPEAIVLSNIYLRSAERVLLVVGRFHAETFEEFFQGIKAQNWESYIPGNGRFWVKKASSVQSALFSPSDLQSVAKKAIVERLKEFYHQEWFKEDGADYPIRLFIYKNEVTVTLDTTGVSLHKRGYRTEAGAAPISETLAAALIMLTPWHGDRILLDPMCGSGTFPIEAAMMAMNIAPGAKRHFTAEKWTNFIDKKLWGEIRKQAREGIKDIDTDIQGYDMDPEVIKIARDNAERAGVSDKVHFQVRSVEKTSHAGKYGFLISNPPYGERLEDKKDLPKLYRALGDAYRRLDSWSMYLITSYEDAERDLGLKSFKNRKIYNGMIKAYFYQFPGPKPPRRKKTGGEVSEG
jgi:putative N6-adenine-specific DNA methylase